MLIDRKAKYSVKADRVDDRDYRYRSAGTPLQEHVDLRKYASKVENQGLLGSCTGQAVVGAYELLLTKETPDKFTDLSRLFVYYNARLIENVVDEDVGAYVRDAVKGVQKYGICSESIWPYHIREFAVTPSTASYEDAKQRNIQNYYRITNFDDILDALNVGFPVVFGMRVYESFEELYFHGNTVSMPKENEEPIGAHAMCFVGYDLNTKTLLARNSFGVNWGMDGYCYVPFDYLQKEVMDVWTFDIKLS